MRGRREEAQAPGRGAGDERRDENQPPAAVLQQPSARPAAGPQRTSTHADRAVCRRRVNPPPDAAGGSLSGVRYYGVNPESQRWCDVLPLNKSSERWWYMPADVDGELNE